MVYYTWLDSPLGRLLLTASDQALTGLYFDHQKHRPTIPDHWINSAQATPFPQAAAQLSEYFAHQRQDFDLPLVTTGTRFQQQVWHALSHIPFGHTLSYGVLAQRLGQPQASRAVGAANGRNPIAIILPCHRVIAANQKLTGYAGGLDRKQWLLDHERAEVPGDSIQTTLSLFP